VIVAALSSNCVVRINIGMQPLIQFLAIMISISKLRQKKLIVSKYYQFYIKILIDYSNQLIFPAITPPSTSRIAPVVQLDLSDNKNTTALATSSADPILPIG
jgi:hypothetical protein